MKDFLQRARLTALLVLCGVIALTTAGAQGAPAQRELRMAYINDVVNMDPAHFAVDDHIAMNVFNGLIRYQARSNAVEADLAERWEVSPDGKVYTFFLRRNAEWHKGYGKFTAADVKYSFDRIKNPETKSRYATILEVIDRADVVNDYTARITLKQAYPDFLPAIVAWRPGWIVNKRAVDELGPNFSRTPIGTGAYEIVSHRPRAEMVFRAHEKYHRGAPQIKNVRFLVIPDENVSALALQRDEVNVMPVRGTQAWLSLARDPNVRMQATPVAGWRGLNLNVTKTPLDDVRIRRAIHHAIDRRSLLDDVLQGFGTMNGVGSIIPPEVWSHTTNIQTFDYNPETARRLLQEAGGMKGVRPRMIFRPAGDDPSVAAAVQQMLRRVGIELQLEQLEQAAYQRRSTSGDFEILIQGPTRAAPDQFLSGIEGREYPSGANQTGYKGVDDLIEKQRFENDSARRRAILVEIQKKVASELPLIQLWRPYYVVATRSYINNPVANYRWWVTWWERMSMQ